MGFRYAPSSPWIVRNLSFDIAAGTSAATIGPSGCGKSAVLRLLLGLLDAEEGRILIGGIDVRLLGKQTIRKMMGAVLQDDVLLARALYRRPIMLVLDEATSNLDVANERTIVQNLHDFAGTRILVAHRPETIASANHVIHLTAVGTDEKVRMKEAIIA